MHGIEGLMLIGIDHNFNSRFAEFLVNQMKGIVDLQIFSNADGGIVCSIKEFDSLREALPAIRPLTDLLTGILGGSYTTFLSLDKGETFVSIEDYAVQLEESQAKVTTSSVIDLIPDRPARG
jgi:hypothetical protein